MIAAIMTTAFAGTAWAGVEIVTFSEQGYDNGQVIEIYEGDNFSINFYKGSNSNAPKYFNTGAAIRCYGGNYFTVSSDYIITSIDLEFASGEGSNLISTDKDTYENGSWTGSANEVTFTIDGTSGHRRIKTVTVTYDTGGELPPSISATNVSIAYDATGGEIEYTVNNPVTGGSVSASTTSDWLAVGDVDDTVPFYCDPNNDAARTATITLTYTYGTKSVNKNVTVTQAGNPNGPGTQDKPYTVAEARAAIDAGTGTQGVYATGIVTAIPTAWSTQYNNITFNFVDNSGDANFLQAYRCVSTDAADASTVAVGDVVVVYGNLKKYNSTYEFDAACQLVSLTHPTVTVEAPIFSPEGGVYTSPQTVTLAVAAPTMEGYSFYYTTDGTEPTTSSTLYTGPIEVSTTTTIKAIAVKDGETSLVATATYAILGHAGTEADPYTVADARDAIDANAGLTDVYATGIVTAIPTAWSAEHSNITFNFVDNSGDENFLQAYRCVSTDAADASTVAVGDIVVVKGTLKKYNTIYEFNAGCQLVSLTHSGTPADPVINAENATIAYNVTYYELMYSIDNPVEGTELTASTTASWITSLTPSQKSFDRVMIECEENDTDADRTATITLTYGEVTKEVTLTQTHFVADYAELPFSFDGGKADIENTDGFKQEGLGSDYGSAPKLKFDSTGDNLILAFNERPGMLTFDIKGNSFSGGTFTVQTSEDGETYTELAAYTELGSKETKTFTDLDEDVRYIKWVYTEKVTGNVALGNINLAKYGAVVLNDYYLTISNPANVTITASYGQDVLTNGEIEEVTEGTEVTVALTIADGYDLESVTVAGEGEGQTVTLSPGTTEGVYTFLMPAFNVTVSATAVEHVEHAAASYVLATTITPGKTYLIVAEDGDQIKVMGVQKNNNRAAVDAVLDGTTLTVDVATQVGDDAPYEFVIEQDGNLYTIYDPVTGGYLYAASSLSNYLRTQPENDDNGLWSIAIDEDGAALVVAQGENTRNHMRYNSGSSIFSCYDGHSTVMIRVRFYEKVEATPTAQTVTVTEAGYATMVAESNLLVPADVEGVYAVQVSGNYAQLIQVDAVPAGAAVIVKANEGSYSFAYTTDEVDAIRVNDLVGAKEDVVADGSQFVLANGAKGIGFYKVVTGSTIAAGKAYLVVTSGVKAFYGFEDDATGIEDVKDSKDLKDLNDSKDAIYNLAGQRITPHRGGDGEGLQHGIYIVNGKKILK